MKVRLYFFLFLIVTFIISGCNKDDEPAQNHFTIGAVIPLTGSGASTGESMNVALGFAVEDVNEYFKTINSEYSVSVKIEDSGTDTTIALQKVTALHDQSIQAIIGPYSSASVKAVKDYADNNDVLIVSPSSVATSLALPGDNIFRLAPADFNQAEALTALLDHDGIRVLIPLVRDDLWGNELLESTKKRFSDAIAGVTIYETLYPTNTTDFTEYLNQIETGVLQALNNYDIEEVGVYFISFGEGTRILNAASGNQTLNQVKWYGSSAYSENESLPQDPVAAAFGSSRHAWCPVFGYDPSAKNKWEPLVQRIQDEIGRKPEIYALSAYDALWLAALTYHATGAPINTNYYRESYMIQANNYVGTTGKTTLNSSGDREFATYDFWGIEEIVRNYQWKLMAKYNNEKKELVVY